MQQLTALYTHLMGQPPKSVEPIIGSGSNRQYVRFTAADGKSIIGVIGTSVEENHAFIALARHFGEKGLPVPRVLAVSDDEQRYLQEDLGSRSLFDALRPAREAGGQYGEPERELLRRTIAALPRLQILGGQGLDFSLCYPQPEMDEMNILFDLNYFKYCYLKTTGVDFHEVRLEQDFHAFAHDLLSNVDFVAISAQHPTFLYRDFQARNVMLDAADKPHFIDFQGGRRGPVYYDLASFLWQASARYPQELRDELITVYLSALREVCKEQGIAASSLPDEDAFRQRLRLFVLFRLLQVLGAYGFRGYFERKQHFIDSIPPALQNLCELLAEEDSCPYPELRQALKCIVQRDSKCIVQSAEVQSDSKCIVQSDSKCIVHSAEVHSDTFANGKPESQQSLCTMHSGTMHLKDTMHSGTMHLKDTMHSGTMHLKDTMHSSTMHLKNTLPLRVRIFSFSYKRGIPEDESGNGGGYVFDCRSTHNPGRYEPFKQLTGLDEPVIKFLEDDGEILTFLQSVYRLADAHVERYLQRGFTDLMFSFGCTGGQHRSVYCAQHLAEHLHKKYGITIDLTHREQGIHTLLD